MEFATEGYFNFDTASYLRVTRSMRLTGDIFRWHQHSRRKSAMLILLLCFGVGDGLHNESL